MSSDAAPAARATPGRRAASAVISLLLGAVAGVLLAFPTIEAVLLLQNVVLEPLGMAAGSAEFRRDRGASVVLGVAGLALTLGVLALGVLGVRRWLAGLRVPMFLGGYLLVQLWVFHDAIGAAWY